MNEDVIDSGAEPTWDSQLEELGKFIGSKGKEPINEKQND